MKIEYFHELSKEQYGGLEASGITWGQIMKAYKQPQWCRYPDALEGEMGCWSLIYGMVTGEHYCMKCELYWPVPGSFDEVGSIVRGIWHAWN